MTWLLWATGAALAVVAVSVLTEFLVEVHTRRRYRPPGRLVDLGGWALHLLPAGKGAPVVLHAGFGGSCLDWSSITDSPPDGLQLWAWDRPGMAWSDRAPGALADPTALVESLHGALASAGVTGPAVHVGHSLGGIHALAFARRYPEAVIGLVLVDSAHPELLERLPPEDARKQFAQAKLLRWARYLAPLGVGRLIRMPVCNMGTAPGELGTIARRLGYQVKGYFALYDEVKMLLSADPRSVMGPLSDLPVAVMSSVHDGPNADLMKKLAEELAGLSSRSRLQLVEDSGHFIQLDRPELVRRAITEIVDAATRTRPLLVSADAE